MNNKEDIANMSDHPDEEPLMENDSKNDSSSSSSPIKVSDDSNSNEILVFTSHHNVYKVQKKRSGTNSRHCKKLNLSPMRNQFT